MLPDGARDQLDQRFGIERFLTARQIPETIGNRWTTIARREGERDFEAQQVFGDLYPAFAVQVEIKDREVDIVGVDCPVGAGDRGAGAAIDAPAPDRARARSSAMKYSSSTSRIVKPASS